MLQLPRALRSTIESHGTRHYPEECCGFLLGTGDAASARVMHVLEAPNVCEDERRRRFLIDARDYMAAERAARNAGLALLGFYHSHPDHPARPSAFDQEHAWPNLHYIVLAVEAGRPGACTSWVLSEDRAEFRQEEIVERVEPEIAPPRPAG